MTLAPDPEFQETADRHFEQKVASNPARRGPLRFQEGLASDTDVPHEFGIGVSQGYAVVPGRANHNLNVFTKSAEETTRERAHVGSATWPEAPTYLSAMAGGASHEAERTFLRHDNGEGNHRRRNYARVD